MATHSSILAWDIPWTEEPDGHIQSMGHKESDMPEATWHAHTHKGLEIKSPWVRVGPERNSQCPKRRCGGPEKRPT